jgi:hypothetical protein
MRLKQAFTLLIIALLFVLSLPESAKATTIDPLIWEQLVADADFIGIVECETAGGIVAEYKVIESWKGAPVGTKLSVRMAINFWGPQFPVTLAGEQYLMTAFKAYAPTRMMSTTSGTPVPLWWRRIPADYTLPLWQGRVLLPLAKDEQPLSALGSEHKDLKSFRESVQSLLALSPEAREVRLLQRLAAKYLFGEGRRAQQQNPPPEILALKSKVNSASSAQEIYTHLIEFAKKKPKERGYPVAAVLEQGGTAATLKLLEAAPRNQLPFESDQYDYMTSLIKVRIGLPVKRDETESDREKPPTEKELAEMRRVMASNPTEEQFYQLFDVMTSYDPALIADYLTRWVGQERDWRDKGRGYVIGSYFAFACGKDREANLRTLLKAQDPYIRVAGAVYLAFENRDAGMAELKELSRLPDDPGVWAALNLVRRGDKSAMTRALEVFKTPGQQTVDGEYHRSFQQRLLILLSNSARKSGVPGPIDNYEQGDAGKARKEKIYQSFISWWETNGERVTLYDAWLPILEQQKVD